MLPANASAFTPSTSRHDRRTSAYSAFVRPIRDRSNLTIATRTRAGYLIFDGTRVVGVRARKGTQPTAHALTAASRRR